MINLNRLYQKKKKKKGFDSRRVEGLHLQSLLFHTVVSVVT